MGRTVGVIAVQGDMDAHGQALERVGARVCPVLFEKDLDDVDALVIPGGESTTISKGLARLGLYAPLRERIGSGLPVLGTCAGAILLAREAVNHPVQTLGLLEVTAVRNAYGTQVDSFAAIADPDVAPGLEALRCVFIRAPQFRDPGVRVEVLARIDGDPILLRQDNLIAAAFHPELTDDPRVHNLLLEMV